MNTLIKLNSVNKFHNSSKNQIHVLKNINLDIEYGDFIMIIGKSGSGKTTLLNSLALLDSFDDGEYIFNDMNISNFTENEKSNFRNQNIGFIFQQFNLIDNINIYSNVELPLLYCSKLSKEEKNNLISSNLDLLGILDKIDYMPNQLSGGQQQRVAIARALINEPYIIFADEPTGALDSETSTEIMNILKGLNNQGKTIIMVTHDIDLLRYATKIVSLKDGVLSLEV